MSSARSATTGRKRARFACRMCHTLKRKCDGQLPCATCVRFEYECSYAQQKRERESSRGASLGNVLGSAISDRVDTAASTPPALQLSSPNGRDLSRSLEANSGPAFLRREALKIDANDAPRLHTFAWNAFLGSRRTETMAEPSVITKVLNRGDMQKLFMTYLQKIDPIYGFVDRPEIQKRIDSRWFEGPPMNLAERIRDAVLCGIAALGCLFSGPELSKTESDLVEYARVVLEQNVSQVPTAASLTAWVLRVVYLRCTDVYHTAWMSSCLLMHMIEAAGLHWEQSDDSILKTTIRMDVELQRRIFAVSQHLNIWISYDMGRSRVNLCNATVMMPSARPGDQTLELMELLPFAAQLDPSKSPLADELHSALIAVLNRTHTSPASVLAQANLAVCLFRRLYSMGSPSSGTEMDRTLALTAAGIRAAQAVCDARAPWHHMANIPFQIICLMLSINTDASFAQLGDAMRCLGNVAKIYSTEATREALQTASLLVLLSKRRKESRVRLLDNILGEFPAHRGTTKGQHEPLILDGGLDGQLLDSDWGFDWSQFLVPAFLKDTDGLDMLGQA